LVLAVYNAAFSKEPAMFKSTGRCMFCDMALVRQNLFFRGHPRRSGNVLLTQIRDMIIDKKPALGQGS
jgi:hypothetical protein